MQLLTYDILYYIYVLIFGIYVSFRLALGSLCLKAWRLFAASCPILLLFQGVSLYLWNMDTVRLLYPLIVHLPVILILALLMKIRLITALSAVIISYSLCQLLRWVGLVIGCFTLTPAAVLILHLSACQLLLFLLDKYCLDAVCDVISSSPRLLSRFSALPALYYIFEYFMLYTSRRYAGVLAFHELLPTAMVLFYILFVIAYQREMEKHRQAKQQTAELELRFAYAAQEISALRAIEERTAIYRHDLRHHMMIIDSLLSAGKQTQASQYISKVKQEMDQLVPARHCANETVNLLLSAFENKAHHAGVRMRIKAALPETLTLPDTELCTLFSNALENALNAALRLPQTADRFIDVFCDIRQNNLVCEIKNSFEGQIAMKNGIPAPQGHSRHYGCRSIQSIVQRRKGVCTFDASSGIFTLRIAVPLDTASPAA